MKFISKPFVLLLLFWSLVAIAIVGLDSFLQAREVPILVSTILIAYYIRYRFTEKKKSE